MSSTSIVQHLTVSKLSHATPFSASLQDKPKVLTKFQRITNSDNPTLHTTGKPQRAVPSVREPLS